MQHKYVTLQVAATYMGAVIGAGFASGQELIYFFVRYGENGFVGLAIAGFLFAIFGMLTISIVNQCQAASYTDLILYTLGPRWGRIFDACLTLFLFAGLCVMVAGSAAIFVEHLYAPFWLGLTVTIICLTVALLAGSEGVLIFNTFLVPLLTVITLLVSFFALGQGTTVAKDIIPPPTMGENLLGDSWIVASILYVSYNMIIGVIVLASVKPKSQNPGVLGGLVGGLGLGVLGMVMAWALSRHFPDVLAYEIPMLFIAQQINPFLKFLYTLVLWFAMLTTALANAFGLAQRLSLGGTHYRSMALAVLAAAIPFTGLSFAQMVGNLYPLFGYVGFFIILAVFVSAAIRMLTE